MQRTVRNLAVALVAGTFAFAAGAQDKAEKAGKSGSKAAASASSGKVVVNGVTIPQARIDAMNKELSAQGQPATPERTAAGFPISVQFVTRHGDEATLFRLSAQLEKARPWFDRKPPVAM